MSLVGKVVLLGPPVEMVPWWVHLARETHRADHQGAMPMLSVGGHMVPELRAVTRPLPNNTRPRAVSVGQGCPSKAAPQNHHNLFQWEQSTFRPTCDLY